ncbi:putative NAD(P)H quinone oxidoreductase, PIG3 family [Bowdeniella nasicola]|uniref:Putative NAD(P)H quinone oxidoreductase, PIG3 family n=1 Tax=Bowdeniella nasicola TaxID=208480 RepID=A0A1H3ZQN0_9ACTO|nr:NAD(P)H-quinone oxidoreductase [Bowdeniella nasicola]SEA25915.1 putative NAD(P)H quinone oxidoreductase, PIG3 family [Bowdeniella nasicola]
MRAIDPSTFAISDLPTPKPKDGEVLIRVHAAGVNRADLLQRAGHYPPPPGASEIPGLEVAGTVVAAPHTAQGVSVGDEVIALLAGGGYAEFVCAPAVQCLPLPSGLSPVEGAGLPEALATSWLNLVDLADIAEGDTVVIHGGSGGVGSVAIQLAARRGARVLTTVGSAEKAARCRALGAEVAVDYHDEDATEQLRQSAGEDGVAIILDILGAGALDSNIDLLARDGRLIMIGLQQGRTGSINLGSVLTERLQIIGSTLRALPVARKGEIVAAMRHAARLIAPQIHASLPLEEVDRAHQLMDDPATFGKIILTLD